MGKINKITTSQIEGRTLSDSNDPNSYSFNEDGVIIYHDKNSSGSPVVGPGLVYGAGFDSGDGAGRKTIKLIPDDLLLPDQHVVVDPTSPNHIHLRAGGTQDNSSSDIFLGAEYTNVQVSDQYRAVYVKSKRPAQSMAHLNINYVASEYLITTDQVSALAGWTIEANSGIYYIQDVQVNTPLEGQTTIYAPGAGFQPNGVYNVFSPIFTNNWTFNENGTLDGPGDSGRIKVHGIQNAENTSHLEVVSSGSMTVNAAGGNMNFYMDGGMYIGASDSTNQIIKRSDLDALPSSYFQSVRWTPNFTATGLTFTGTDTTHPTYNSHYVKQGQLVSFWIAIDLATVTNFGTGQLKVDLPFAPLAGTMNHFSGWVHVDETVNPDNAGHIIVNADHLPLTQTIDLHYIKQSAGANSPVMEAILKQGTPVTLTTATNIYINGTYIAAS